ncbi:DUF1501 domain-containing protein [Lysobacter humi (ex Lee et al. 2017)]
MNTPRITRRQFLKGCCVAASTAAAGPRLVFGDDAHAAPNGYDTLVFIFLRGGIDGLNLVLPVDGNDRGHYEQARPTLAIPASGTYGALPLATSGTATGFGLHPSATGLRDLWASRKLAVVHACGLLTAVTRSHFDAQLLIDQGLSRGGWMARAIESHPGGLNATMSALAAGSRQPASLNGATQAITMDTPADFSLNAGAYAWQRTRSDSPAGLVGLNETLPQLWGGTTAMEQSGKRAHQALSVIASQPYGATPAGWPTGAFARQLWTVAQSIKFDLGLRYAAIDLGGWDTHDGQGSAGAGYHYYQNKIAELSAALAAFHAELDVGGQASRVTVVVQSEFGRRVRENAARGTDHGYGNPVLVLGGAVNGGRFYGQWPGLAPETLSATYGDVPVTTDFRRVLSEILVRRMGNPNLSTVFPQYAGYAPMGIVQGIDAPTTGVTPIEPTSPVVIPADTQQTSADLAVERQLRARGGSLRDQVLRRNL